MAEITVKIIQTLQDRDKVTEKYPSLSNGVIVDDPVSESYCVFMNIKSHDM